MQVLAGQLVFSCDVATQLSALSDSLFGVASTTFRLGDQTPPHVTLFKRAGAPFPVKPFAGEGGMSVDFVGACYLGAEHDMVWAAIAVRKTPLLHYLRQQGGGELAADEARWLEFMPHVTLACVHTHAVVDAVRRINGSPLAQMSAIACRFEWVAFEPHTGYRRYDCNGTAI